MFATLKSDFASPLNRTVLLLALPTIVMNISLPLLGAVDTAVVGHLGEAYYVGAVGLGSMVCSIVYWAFGFSRMSTVGLTAQAHGAGDDTECMNVLARAWLIGMGLGLAVLLLRTPLADLSFYLIDATPEVERHGSRYIEIRILAAPAVFSLQVLQGWFYGIQNVRFPVFLTVLVNGVNVALDFVLVRGLGFTSDGVAWATVASQYLGMAVALGVFGRRYGRYWKRASYQGTFQWVPMRTMFFGQVVTGY